MARLAEVAPAFLAPPAPLSVTLSPAPVHLLATLLRPGKPAEERALSQRRLAATPHAKRLRAVSVFRPTGLTLRGGRVAVAAAGPRAGAGAGRAPRGRWLRARPPHGPRPRTPPPNPAPAPLREGSDVVSISLQALLHGRPSRHAPSHLFSAGANKHHILSPAPGPPHCHCVGHPGPDEGPWRAAGWRLRGGGPLPGGLAQRCRHRGNAQSGRCLCFDSGFSVDGNYGQ